MIRGTPSRKSIPRKYQPLKRPRHVRANLSGSFRPAAYFCRQTTSRRPSGAPVQAAPRAILRKDASTSGVMAHRGSVACQARRLLTAQKRDPTVVCIVPRPPPVIASGNEFCSLLPCAKTAVIHFPARAVGSLIERGRYPASALRTETPAARVRSDPSFGCGRDRPRFLLYLLFVVCLAEGEQTYKRRPAEAPIRAVSAHICQAHDAPALFGRIIIGRSRRSTAQANTPLDKRDQSLPQVLGRNIWQSDQLAPHHVLR